MKACHEFKCLPSEFFAESEDAQMLMLAFLALEGDNDGRPR